MSIVCALQIWTLQRLTSRRVMNFLTTADLKSFTSGKHISLLAYPRLTSPHLTDHLNHGFATITHCRSHWPANEEAKAVIILLHGYSSHSSRPTQGYYESHFAAKGYAYVGLDLHGHGYSEGLKGLVTSVDNLVDDVLSLLIALYSKVFFEFHGEETDSVRRFHLRNYAWNVPFFILGQSMGGSTAMCVANHLGNILKQSDSDQRLLTIAKHFQGCVLFCPAIVLKPPSPFVMAILNNFIVPFFGTASIPEFIQSTNSNQSSIWKNKEFLEYVHRDG